MIMAIMMLVSSFDGDGYKGGNYDDYNDLKQL